MADPVTETAGGPAPAPGEAPLTLKQAAVLHGAYRWAELRLFALTGAWAAGPGVPPALRVHLFEASAQHAGHAARWQERLPVLATVDRDALTRPAGPVLGPVMAKLAEDAPAVPVPDAPHAAGSEPAAAGLRFVAGLYRVVLPALVGSYRRHATRLSPVADEPSRRTVADVLRAEEAEIAAACDLLREVGTAGEDGPLDGPAEAIRRLLGGPEDPTGDLVPWSDGHCAW